MNRLVPLLAAATFAACDCSGGPGTGVCNGTWAGRTFVDAGLDPESRMVIVRTQVCTIPDLNHYELSWQEHQLALDFSFTNGGPSSLAPAQYTLPPGSGTETFMLNSYGLNPDADGGTGSLRLTILGLRGRRGGTLDLTAGADHLTCVFEVPYTTEGARVCGGSSSGGDADFD